MHQRKSEKASPPRRGKSRPARTMTRKKVACSWVVHASTGIERQPLDHFTKIVEREFKAMAARLDRTNRRVDRLFARLANPKTKTLPRLGKFRAKLRTRPTTESSRLRQLERPRR